MANEEHLEMLSKGVEEWNRWREENPEVLPDLTEARLDLAHLNRAHLADAHLDGARFVHADLEGARLEGARLEGASLAGASLVRAILDGADLDGAILARAILVGARLVRASLDDADLDGARLEGARLEGASLDRASLAGASLVGASLVGASLADTILAAVDLRQVKGLESVEHRGPSTIGTDTLKRSQGQIPAAFLRGCGLSDWEIEAAKLYDPDLDEDEINLHMYEMVRLRGKQPFAVSRVFLSYTREDEPFVETLEKRFDEKGVRYWRDVHDLKAGRLERQIDRAITLYPLVLLVLSEKSVSSDWVEWEAAKARKLEKEYEKAREPRDVLCPVALDNAWKSCTWPGPLRRQIEDYNVLDFSGWEHDEEKMGRQFDKLYKGMVINYGRKNERPGPTAERERETR